MRRDLVLACWLALSAALWPSGSAGQADAPADDKREAIAKEVASLQLRDPLGHGHRKILSIYTRYELCNANFASSRAWYDIQSRDEWLAHQRACLAKMRKGLGIEDPPAGAPQQLVTRTIEGEGYTIENLVYESWPGLPVTANLYRPSPRRASMPAILIAHSHHAPKTQGELQDMGVSWARVGCLVLVIDMPGHGERRQHPFDEESDYPKPFRVGRQDYYFRYNSGRQLSATGSSLMAWMVHDLRRGIDLLLARPGADPKRVILLGAVAGGGDPAAVTAAVDNRVTVAVPFYFGGPQPETTYPLPDNADETFRYAGGGSWESTRNLQGSAAGGYLPWVIVGSIAPRRLIYGHEFVWDQQRDPVWARLQTLYRMFNAEDQLAFTHGHGRLSGQPPEASHCTNIGAAHRELIYQALEKWYQIPPAKVVGDERRPAEELVCLTGAARETFYVRPLHEVAVERIRADAESLAAPLLRRRWSAVVGNVVPTVVSQATLLGQSDTNTISCEEWLLTSLDPNIALPFTLLRPSREPIQSPLLAIMVCSEGSQLLLAGRRQLIAELLSQGIDVCLADVRGTRLARPDNDRGRTSEATSISSSLEMLGKTLLGEQVRDLRSLIAHLKTRSEINPKRIALWGDSLAEPNSPDANFAAPLDAPDLPRQGEPMGASAALLTALFEPDIRAVYVRGGLVSRQSALAGPFMYLPHDALQPTAGHADPGDWKHVVRALEPRAVRLEAMIDGLNRRVSREDLEREFLLPSNHDASTRPAWQPVVNGEESQPVEAAEWLRKQLNR